MAKKHSNPIVEQEFTLNTSFAQQAYDRTFPRASSSLFAIDVILRLIGHATEIDEVEGAIATMMQDWMADQANEIARLQTVLEANGVNGAVAYTAPLHTRIQIQSPQTARLLEIMRRYDQLVMAIDALWLNDLMPSKDRSRLIHDWKRRTQRLGNRIVDIERRAHAAVNRRRQEEERAEAVKAPEADEGARATPEISSGDAGDASAETGAADPAGPWPHRLGTVVDATGLPSLSEECDDRS